MEKMIFVNLKMYLNTKEDVKNYIDKLKGVNMVFFPSSIYIQMFIDNGFICGCQDVSSYLSGAHTSEISAVSIKDIGCLYTLIGHSEVGDNREKEKIKASLDNDLIPILCVGEKKNQDKYETLDRQLSILSDICGEVIIAYEPVWSIGTGNIPSCCDIEDSINYIKSKYPRFKVLYGGSVNENNIDVLNNIKNIDGFLLGTSGVDVGSLLKIKEVVLK